MIPHQSVLEFRDDSPRNFRDGSSWLFEMIPPTRFPSWDKGTCQLILARYYVLPESSQLIDVILWLVTVIWFTFNFLIFNFIIIYLQVHKNLEKEIIFFYVIELIVHSRPRPSKRPRLICSYANQEKWKREQINQIIKGPNKPITFFSCYPECPN